MKMEITTLLAVLGLILTAFGIFLAFVTFKYSDHKTTLQDKRSRAKAIANLKSPTFNRIYKNILRKGLALLALRFGKRRGITFEGLSFLYIISYTYIIAFFCISWIISGSGDVGGLSILPAIDSKFYRLLIGLALSVTTYIYFLLFREIIGIDTKVYNFIYLKTNKKFNKVEIKIIIKIFTIFLLSNITFNFVSLKYEDYKILFIFFILISAIIPIPVLFISTSLAVAYWLTNSISIIAPIFLLGMYWGLLKIKIPKNHKFERKNIYMYIVLLPIAISFKTFMRPEEYMRNFEPTVLLFMSLLPVSNLIFDFVSWEISRRIGYKILRARSVMSLTGYLVLDIILASVLLVSLVIFLTIFIEFFNYATELKGGKSYFDLVSIIKTSIVNPLSSSNIWITLMLFTTLIPTLINGSIIIVGYLTRVIPLKLRNIVIYKLENYAAKSDLNMPAWYFSVKWVLSINTIFLALIGSIYLINITFNPMSYYLSEISLSILKLFNTL